MQVKSVLPGRECGTIGVSGGSPDQSIMLVSKVLSTHAVEFLNHCYRTFERFIRTLDSIQNQPSCQNKLYKGKAAVRASVLHDEC